MRRRCPGAVFEPWGPGDVFRSGLREIVAVRAALDALETELVVGARSRGSKWRELGEDLGLSAHGARKRHLAADPIHARRSQRETAALDVEADVQDVAVLDLVGLALEPLRAALRGLGMGACFQQIVGQRSSRSG